ncbi:MAG: biotin--[acetyl-CoA-carboxylase] ligase [Acidobacteria bacterium]|nr:MAG: biotin--[acetyl-CoA-carboxylase] ligase [Acidobacteriota bacterium]
MVRVAGLLFVLSHVLPHNSAITKSPTTPVGKVSRAGAAAPRRSYQSDVRLGQIVRLLMDHATVVVSGTKISQQIGTTRSQVWRLIQQLRRLGVDIAGHPATGYQLRALPDLLLPDILAPLVRGTIFSEHIHHYYKIGSTNIAALEAATAGAPEGSVFLTEEQTAGRGRSSRSWHSSRSAGIYCSVVLRPLLPPADVLILALAVALAVKAAVEEIGANLKVDLRWPNDLLLEGKKFCGILTEMSAEATRVRHLVVGIGVNVNHSDFPASIEKEATSLRLATGTEWSRVELTAALLKSLDREYRNLLRKPDAPGSILRRFSQQSSYVRGMQVHVDENGGFDGVTESLDPRGFLQVRTAHGMRTVLSGSVRPKPQ